MSRQVSRHDHLPIVTSAREKVLIIGEEPDTALISENAQGSHFAVLAYDYRSNLLVNTTNRYEGRVIVRASGRVFEVKGVGACSITLE
jgi:hypothetical protein